LGTAKRRRKGKGNQNEKNNQTGGVVDVVFAFSGIGPAVIQNKLMLGTTSALANAKATGYVKWFNEQKGFGFLSNEKGGPDVYVHYSAIAHKSATGHKTLDEGDRVEYTIVIGPSNKPMARDVRVIK
jgi:cold shock protein